MAKLTIDKETKYNYLSKKLEYVYYVMINNQAVAVCDTEDEAHALVNKIKINNIKMGTETIYKTEI